MSRDWIKMRPGLMSDSHVLRMANHLAADPDFKRWFNPSTTAEPCTCEHDSQPLPVTLRNVTRSLCVTALLLLWGNARENGHPDGDDLVIDCCDIDDLSLIADLPGFGPAMASVGWAIEEPGPQVRFPKLLRDNVSAEDRLRKANAERQARHRAKVKAMASSEPPPKVDVTDRDRNVTVARDRNVIVTVREDKNREEHKSLGGEERAFSEPPPNLFREEGGGVQGGREVTTPDVTRNVTPDDLSPESLAREWEIRHKGAGSQHNAVSVSPIFAEWIDKLAIPPVEILAEILRPGRPLDEATWSMRDRLRPQRGRANGKTTGFVDKRYGYPANV